MWIKNFRTRKLQTVMIFLVVMLSSTLLIGAAGILLGLEQPFYDLAKDTNAPTARFFSDGDEAVTVTTMEKFRQLDEVKQVECVKFHYATEEIKANGTKIEAFIRLTEYQDAVYSKITYLEGGADKGRQLREGECLVPACISKPYDLHIGDSLSVEYPEGEKQYKIAGIYTSSFNTTKAISSDILVKQLEPKSSATSFLCIYGKENVTGEEIERAYRLQNDGILNGLYYTLDQNIGNNLMAGNIIGAVFLAIGIIMLFVSILIIQFMIRNAMLQDADKIAIYKVIGYTSKDILKMYVTFYFVLASAAVWSGIIGSVFLSNQILMTIYENLGKTKGATVLLPGVVCYILIIGLILFLTMNIVSRYDKRKPVITLTGYTDIGIKKTKEYKGNNRMQFSPFGIAYRTIIRDKKSVIGVLITCIVTIFAINFAVISLDVANEMKNQNDFWIGIDKSDVVVSLSSDSEIDKINTILSKDERVREFFQASYANGVNLKWKKGMNLTSMNANLYEDFTQIPLSVVQGRNPANSKEIAIGTKVAAMNNKQIGDYLEVYLDSNHKANFLITGTFQSYNEFGAMSRLTTDAFTLNQVPFHYNNLSIYLNKGVNQEEFIEELKKVVGTTGTVMPRTDQYASIMDMISLPQQKAVPPVIILVVLLGCMNIFCIVMLKNMSHQKTNAIYKCIGYSTIHLMKSNMLYVGIIGLISMFIALPTIIYSYSKIMMLCLSMFHFKVYPVSFNLAHIVISNLGVMVVFVFSTYLSSRSLKYVNARELVKE